MNTEKIKNIMKKPLNEEINRIKSIMGCCKGKINEDQENCVDPESPEGQQAIDRAVGYVKYELDKLYKESGVDVNFEKWDGYLDTESKRDDKLNKLGVK